MPRDTVPPQQDEIIGRWVETSSGLIADEACTLIDDMLARYLSHVADHPRERGWRTLFRDRRDGRLWERVYPQCELHGGGPPLLRCITLARAKSEFDL